MPGGTDAEAGPAARPAAGARAAGRARAGSRVSGDDRRAAPVVLAVVGPTASGKSALGIALAEAFGGEVLNCDSTAVYRGFDIGTDKVPEPLRRGIPHHLIDIADPSEGYTAASFARDAAHVIREV
ncbi:MAG: tRNA (adenosine(37)-N6)-dimethylallyltransferase MiaA, partial [Acidimicrobiia bacterium]|nr:tRNA (adenosine(37)-N6)-dimethylallyltransferase MiaA [Acidimicrobiia bacterium]